MPDTSRTLAANLTQFADNTSKDITAQFARDALVSFNALCGPEISVTGTTTATVGQMHVCSGTSADYTVTLPAASGNAGRLIGFRMATGLTKLVTLDGNSSETIDGSLTRVMWAGEACMLLCDGSNWFKVGGVTIPMMGQMSRDAAQSFANNTVTKCSFDTSVFSVGGLVNIGSSRFDIKRSGYYAASGYFRIDDVAGMILSTDIYKNGSSLAAGATIGAATQNGHPMSQLLSLAAGDYIELHVYQSSGASRNNYTVTGSQPRMSLVEVPTW